jgi:hypothetical protein
MRLRGPEREEELIGYPPVGFPWPRRCRTSHSSAVSTLPEGDGLRCEKKPSIMRAMRGVKGAPPSAALRTERRERERAIEPGNRQQRVRGDERKGTSSGAAMVKEEGVSPTRRLQGYCLSEFAGRPMGQNDPILLLKYPISMGCAGEFQRLDWNCMHESSILPELSAMTRLLLALAFSFSGIATAQLREIPLPFPDSTRFKVQFVDEMHGWVSSLGGSILRTTDGGVSWEKFMSPYPKPVISEIVFCSKDYGVLWADSTRGNYRGRLYRTEDGGKTWAQVSTPDSIWIAYDQGLSQTPYAFSITLLAPDVIAYTGGRSWRMGNGPMQGEVFVASTTDGGVTWRTGKLIAFNTVYALASGKWGTFRVSPELPDIVPVSVFWTSDDSGATWSVKKIWDDVPMLAAQFWDGRHGAAYCTRFQDGVFMTSDGGNTWEQWKYTSPNYFSGVLVRDSILYAIAGPEPGQSNYDWKLPPHGAVNRVTREGGLHGAWSWPNFRTVIPWPLATSITSAGDKVFVLTIEGRLFVIDEALVDVPPLPQAIEKQSLILSPNPVGSTLTVMRRDEARTKIEMRIYNSLGVRMCGEQELILQPGEVTATVRTERLPAGMYYLTSSESEMMQTIPFTVIH